MSIHRCKDPKNDPQITHLLYANDAILIGEWNSQNIANKKSLLWSFNIISGLRINFMKSEFHGVNVTPIDLDTAANQLKCNHNPLPFKYLGLMVGANMNRATN